MQPIDVINEGTTSSLSQSVWDTDTNFKPNERNGQNSFLPKLTIASADCDWACEMDQKREEDLRKHLDQQREDMQKRFDDMEKQFDDQRKREERNNNNIMGNPMLRNLIFGF